MTPPTPLAASKDWKRILPGLVISLVSLAVVFYLADPRKLVKQLSLADYRLVAAAVLLNIAWLLVRAAFWRTLLKKRATLQQTFFTINEGYLLNNLLPFRLGEVGRAFLLGKKAGLGFWQVFSTIIIERALDIAMAAGLLLSTLPLVIGMESARSTAILMIFLVLAGMVVLHLAARYQGWVLAQFARLGARWPRLLNFTHRLETFFDGLAVLTDFRLFLSAIFLLALDWAIAIVQYYVLLLAFLPLAPFLWAAFTLAIAAFGIAAPSSPGAVGVYEGAVMMSLALFKVGGDIALAFAVTAHLMNYILTGILGAIGLAQDGESLAGLYQSVRRIPREERT